MGAQHHRPRKGPRRSKRRASLPSRPRGRFTASGQSHCVPRRNCQISPPAFPLTHIEHMYYDHIKRYLCGSGRAWAAHQRAVRLVTGHPNSVGGSVIPPDANAVVAHRHPELAKGPLVARNSLPDEHTNSDHTPGHRKRCLCPLVPGVFHGSLSRNLLAAASLPTKTKVPDRRNAPVRDPNLLDGKATGTPIATIDGQQSSPSPSCQEPTASVPLTSNRSRVLQRDANAQGAELIRWRQPHPPVRAAQQVRRRR